MPYSDKETYPDVPVLLTNRTNMNRIILTHAEPTVHIVVVPPFIAVILE